MYTVTRQSQWATGDNVVEVSYGGIDYCNPDALVKKYDGEFEEFRDPREAAEVAIRICQEWRKDRTHVSNGLKYKADKQRPKVGAGATSGWTMPFEPSTFKELRAWAKAEWNSLEKCNRCGEPLPEKRKRWRADDWSGMEYCSEYCAEKEIEWQQEQEEAGQG